MKNYILELYEPGSDLYKISSTISLAPFVDYIKAKIESESSIKKCIYQDMLKKFEAYGDAINNISTSEITKYEELLEYIYLMLMPPIADEKKTLWALSKPLAPVILYGTDGFYNLISDAGTHMVKASIIKDHKEKEDKKENIGFFYCFLLKKLFDINPDYRGQIVHSLYDDETGIKRYYRMDLDDRFLRVIPNQPIPEIDIESLRHKVQEMDFSGLEHILPLDMFSFEGFAVSTLTDITGEYAIESIKNLILSHNVSSANYNYKEVVQALQLVVGNKDIEFGLLPMFKVNNKLAFNSETSVYSIVVGAAESNSMAEQAYITVAEHYFENPAPLFLRTIEPEGKQAPKKLLLTILKNAGIKSFALLPVFYNNKIMGVLEMYTKVDDVLNENLFYKLDTAIPLIAQLLKNNIDAFDGRIDAIIREKFTSIQPAVRWKFIETAWHYMRDNFTKNNGVGVEPIAFTNVYPLYGAIDIRNSTAERAHALMGDMQTRFVLLIETLTQLKGKLSLPIIDEKLYLAKKWEQALVDFSISSGEVDINLFLEKEIHDFLLHFKQQSPDTAAIVKKYFDAIGNESGIAHNNRRDLEASMELINNAVNEYLEKVKGDLQQYYPSYFEKFRSDGIEYDIYTGQSLAPDKPFSLLYFHNLRLWQLTNMAEITRLTHSLMPQMKRPLQTTQLIFIHPDTIDISFRMDERRFDVEGAYNIRYQVVKKRIDKAVINNTQERLTQPGKIAMVYFNEKDAKEYIKYIGYLQNQDVLLNDVERLELEDLQGVSGLKALRVGVNLEYNKPEIPIEVFAEEKSIS